MGNTKVCAGYCGVFFKDPIYIQILTMRTKSEGGVLEFRRGNERKTRNVEVFLFSNKVSDFKVQDYI